TDRARRTGRFSSRGQGNVRKASLPSRGEYPGDGRSGTGRRSPRASAGDAPHGEEASSIRGGGGRGAGRGQRGVTRKATPGRGAIRGGSSPLNSGRPRDPLPGGVRRKPRAGLPGRKGRTPPAVSLLCRVKVRPPSADVKDLFQKS